MSFLQAVAFQAASGAVNPVITASGAPLLVFARTGSTTTPPTVVDNHSGTWTQVGSLATNATDGHSVACFANYTPFVGSLTITVTPNAGSNRGYVIEWGGIQASGFDSAGFKFTETVSFNGPADLDSGSLGVVSQDSNVLFGTASDDNGNQPNWSMNAGWTERGGQIAGNGVGASDAVIVCENVVSNGTTVAPDFTVHGSGAGGTITATAAVWPFKLAAAAAPAVTTRSLPVLRAGP